MFYSITSCRHIFQTLLRIWDCLFYEGNKIIFRVALTLIKLHARQLCDCKGGLPDIVEVFKAMPKSAEAQDCHKFMKVRREKLFDNKI